MTPRQEPPTPEEMQAAREALRESTAEMSDDAIAPEPIFWACNLRVRFDPPEELTHVDSSAARGQEFAQRIGICLLDYEMFWWRADNGEACPVCSTDDEGYEANHRFFVAEIKSIPVKESEDELDLLY